MEYLLFLASALVSRIVNLLGPLGRRRPERTLVVKLDHIGDLVNATPVFRALHEAAPHIPVDALVGPWGVDLLVANPFLDRVLCYDSARYRRGSAPPDRGAWRRMREVAAARYTTVVELRGDAWTLALPFLSGSRRRVDRGSVRIADWLARRLGRREALPPLHEVGTNLAVVGTLLQTPPRPRVELFVAADARLSVEGALARSGMAAGQTFVCIHPGASWRPKAWSIERFAEIARRIVTERGANVAFVGSRDERDLEANLRRLLSGEGFHFFFGGSLSEVVALLERADLVVGNDSGLEHAAAAVGTPVIALFGPQTPDRFRPWGERVVVLHRRAPCCPCAQRVCVFAENPCVNWIEVEEVWRAVDAMLSEVRR